MLFWFFFHQKKRKKKITIHYIFCSIQANYCHFGLFISFFCAYYHFIKLSYIRSYMCVCVCVVCDVYVVWSETVIAAKKILLNQQAKLTAISLYVYCVMFRMYVCSKWNRHQFSLLVTVQRHHIISVAVFSAVDLNILRVQSHWVAFWSYQIETEWNLCLYSHTYRIVSHFYIFIIDVSKRISGILYSQVCMKWFKLALANWQWITVTMK